jgi:hypothetical protein
MSWINDEYQKLDQSPRSLRRFGIMVGAILLGLGGLLFLRHRNAGPPLLGAGTLLLLAAAFAPVLLRYLHKPWMMGALLLGRIMTTILLTIVFFLVVTPIALLQRLCGKRPLELRFRTGAATYWQTRPPPPVSTDYEKQF